MPKPTLTVIEGGGQPLTDAERSDQAMKRVEESLERLENAIGDALRQAEEDAPRFSKKSWRSLKKWRP
jgi:hypothetical protein